MNTLLTRWSRLSFLAILGMTLVSCGQQPPSVQQTPFDKLPKEPTARLQRLVSITPKGEFNSYTDRASVLNDIQQVLREGADIEAFQDPQGYNALQLAARSGATDAVKLLLDAGAKIDSRCRGGYSALHIAAYKHHYEVCKLLLEHGANPQAKGPKGETPLAVAIQRPTDDNRVVELLTKSGGDPQSLHVAALAGDVKQLKAILAKGANVNERDQEGKTPLYIAAEQGKAGAIAVLLDAKANISIEISDGNWAGTALMAAAHKGHAEVVQLFFDKAATISAEEKHRALYWALSKWHVKVCQILVEHGASYREKMAGDGDRPLLATAWATPSADIRALFVVRGEQMPLWAACQHGDTKAVHRLLATSGINPDERSPDGLTPLHLAVRSGHLDLAKILLDKGADINLPATLMDETALHFAVAASNEAAVELLIARKANLNALSMGGRSPLYCAAVLRSNIPIVRALIDAGADITLLPNGEKDGGKTRLSDHVRNKKMKRLIQRHE